MTIDYIGQELIWNLLGTNPYHKNTSHYFIKINCKTRMQNEEAAKFILAHIPYSKVKDVVMESDPIGVSTDKITKRIDIKNVFDGISSVEFINDTKYFEAE